MKNCIDTPFGTTNEIIKRISESYGLKNGGVMSNSRKQCYVIPRQVAMHFLYCICGIKLEQIGAILGRDHTTVWFGINAVRDRKSYDQLYTQEYERAKASAINKEGEFLHIPLPLF